jgi:Cyclopropane fatty acid synthase and related methyltransferases
MFNSLMMNLRKPDGFWGHLILSLMNYGHTPIIKWALSFVPLTSTDTVLDIGCGGGGAIRRMAQTSGKVYGVDYSETSVATARSKNKKAISQGKVDI